MAGSIQKTVILAKVETASGTDAAPTHTADAVAIRVSNLSVKVTEKFAERDTIIGAFAAPDRLPYTRRAEVTFSCELQSSGTLGTAPAWGDLLIGCGFAEAITAGARVDYTPSSIGLKTLTIWAYINDRLEKYNFCAGTFKLNMSVGKVPSLDFTFTGLVSSVTASAGVTPTLTGWIRPEAVGPVATTQLSLGAATYSAGAITGGTAYNFKDFSIDCANDVQDLELATQETVAIYGRAPTCSLTADLGPSAHANLVADMHAGAARALGLVHGSASGRKVLVYAPVGVITSVSDQVDGTKMFSAVDLTLRPSSANDDFRIVAI